MTRCYRRFSDNLLGMPIGAVSVRYACSRRLIALLIRQFQSQNRILSTMLAFPQKLQTDPPRSRRERRSQSSYSRAELTEQSRYQTETTSHGPK
jgi:hypothetical protein